MAILASIQILKDKILQKIKGASTGSTEKTKAIDHREVLTDVVDTLNDKIEEATIASGSTGDVQVKGGDGKLFGSSSFNFLNGILSLAGNFVIKGLSSSSDNALQIKNANNVVIGQVTNNGYLQFNRISAVGNIDNYVIYYDGYANIRGYDGTKFWRGQNDNINNLLADFGTFNRCNFQKPIQAKNGIFTNDIEAGDTVFGYTETLRIKGQRATITNNWLNPSGTVEISDGKPRPDQTGQGYGGKGVLIRSWRREPAREPVLETVFEVKEGDKIAFYGGIPIARQTLAADPRPAEISTVLFNLGLVIRP